VRCRTSAGGCSGEERVQRDQLDGTDGVAGEDDLRHLVRHAERLGDGPGVASALGVWAMGFMAMALATAAALVGKKAGAAFRG